MQDAVEMREKRVGLERIAVRDEWVNRLCKLKARGQIRNHCGGNAIEAGVRHIFEVQGTNRELNLKKLGRLLKTTHYGTLHKDMVNICNELGVLAVPFTRGSISLLKFLTGNGIPVIVGIYDQSYAVKGDHFVVVKRVTSQSVYVADSSSHHKGERRIPRDEFELFWKDCDKGWRIVHGWGIALFPKMEFKTKLIDGEKYRREMNPDFSTATWYLLGRGDVEGLPHQTILLEQSTRKERKFFELLANVEYYLLHVGDDFDTYRAHVANLLCSREKPFKFEKVTLESYKFGRNTIRIVDGAKVRRLADPYFTSGGHHFVYLYVPEDEWWVDGTLPRELWATILVHEANEEYRMSDRRGDTQVGYDIAHPDSERVDHIFRRICNIPVPGETESVPKHAQLSPLERRMVKLGLRFRKDIGLTS